MNGYEIVVVHISIITSKSFRKCVVAHAPDQTAHNSVW